MAKKILFITHQLSRTGAPIVLLDMIRFCKNRGDTVFVISMMDGELRQELESLEIEVKIQERFITEYEVFLKQAEWFDYVVANTLITFEAVQVLKFSKVPVLWWLHEGKQYFEYFQSVLPDFNTLSENIRVYAVSIYVQQILEELYHYKAPILALGVKDTATAVESKIKTSGKLHCVVSGTYSKVKGQDILAAAFAKMTEEEQEKLEITFYGNLEMRDEEVYCPVEQLAQNSKNIRIMPFQPHDKMLKIIAETDLLIVPSRLDPLPTVVVEAMMNSVPCLCSNVCGIANYIQDGKNGFTFYSEDVDALAKKIVEVEGNREHLYEVGKKGREVFEKYFDSRVFEGNVEEIIS